MAAIVGTSTIFATVAGTQAAQKRGVPAETVLKTPRLPAPIEKSKNQEEPTDADRRSVENGADLAFGAFQRGYYLTALKLALPRAESGDPAAQTLIGEIYDRGLGVAKDRKQAAFWFKYAAESGNREAQFAYANLLIEGKVVEFDKAGARALLEKAAQAGHAKASFNLAQIIVADRPSAGGFKDAVKLYQFAAEAGVPDAQYAMASVYSNGLITGVPDFKQARFWMQQAAARGIDTAQVELGIWMVNGKGGPKDEKAGLIWLKAAAVQRNAIAQNRLANIYLSGIGVPPDPVKAASWHILAKRQGHVDTRLEAAFQRLPDIDKKRAIEIANRWR
ncbi:MAG: SEL1-like repeat protein [Pseudomonadota bacterium]